MHDLNRKLKFENCVVTLSARPMIDRLAYDRKPRFCPAVKLIFSDNPYPFKQLRVDFRKRLKTWERLVFGVQDSEELHFESGAFSSKFDCRSEMSAGDALADAAKSVPKREYSTGSLILQKSA